jgi:beta-glucanase (GH16 family)
MFSAFLISFVYTLIMTPIDMNNIPDDEKKWSMLWEDDFSSNEIDFSKWNIIPRNRYDWGKYMSDHKECIQVKNGKLYLRGIINDNPETDPVPYLTGGLETRGKFSFLYGKIEIRAKLEGAKGAWPAIWMLADQPKYGEYPLNGEIDIMERINFDKNVHQTVHTYYTLEMNGHSNPPNGLASPVDPEEFNIYGLEWYPDRLVFTINNKASFIYPRIDEADYKQWPFDQPFYLMIDMQLSGPWVGEVEPDHLPAQMIIDWVRVYNH